MFFISKHVEKLQLSRQQECYKDAEIDEWNRIESPERAKKGSLYMCVYKCMDLNIYIGFGAQLSG